METDSDFQQTPFVKQLAANDRPTRDEAVSSLKLYLSSRGTFTRLDFLKIWKGLFYCMWMSDRPLTQQKLADVLASLVSAVRDENTLMFLEVFWSTMAREWNNIDALRMNKFLLLVRRYVAATFSWLEGQGNEGWDEETVGDMMDILRDVPLNPTDRKIPDGVRYHVLDLYLDELAKFFPEEEEDEEEDGEESEQKSRSKTSESENLPPLNLLLAPIEELAEKGATKSVRKRAKDVLGDKRIEQWKNL